MVQIIKERTREGWNINGMDVPNWQYIKEQAKRNPPRWTTIMDNGDKCREWKDEIGGEVTNRSWGTGEDSIHSTMNPKSAAQQMARESEKTADCWQYWKMNEPSTGGTVAGWLALQDWLIDYATEAKRLGRKVTTNGLALLKNWDYPAFVQAGYVDKLMKFWADDNNREWFIPNVHVYITGAAWSSVTPNYPANLLDRQATLDGKRYHINTETYEPIMWYHRELWAFNIRAKEIIGEPVEFIMDECKYDYHASVHQAFVTLPDGRRVKMEDELRALSDPLFEREMKGILGQRKWAEWIITGQHNSPIPDERYCDWLIENDQWWEGEYPDNCLAFMNFTMNPAWRYPYSGGGFGHDANPLIFALLPRKANIKPRHATPIPVPAPNPQPSPAFETRHIQGNGTRVTLREKANVNSAMISALAAAPVVTVAEVSTVIEDAGGYQWRKVRYNGMEGYLAFKYVVDAPEPIDPRVPILVGALKAVRNGFVDEVDNKAASILYLEEILAQFEIEAG